MYIPDIGIFGPLCAVRHCNWFSVVNTDILSCNIYCFGKNKVYIKLGYNCNYTVK